jgi:hypothetical protein
MLPVLLVLAGVKLAVQLAVAGRYGWHRDELYDAAAGRHLAFGYPDFPPGTSLLARGAEIVFGGSLAGFRVLPAVAGAVLVIVARLPARELGGGTSAQAPWWPRFALRCCSGQRAVPDGDLRPAGLGGRPVPVRPAAADR